MTKVKVCEPCGIMVELYAVNEKDNSKIAFPIQKCPFCGKELTDDTDADIIPVLEEFERREL